ncbi:MAG: hypothetical protein AB7U46_06935 [Paenirhodobacter sp.]|uniref:hypothetical protein n=1 Tax=Paenirhodobacter sp. TaxID=1965326 RepID=UPI003D12575C
MTLLRRLWAEQRVALIGFVIAVGLAAFFGGRIVVRAVYWANPAHHRQLPEPWMTPGYIARSWHLPPEAIDGVLGDGVGPGFIDHGPPTLERIAAKQGVPVGALIERLDSALPALAAQEPAK